MNDARIGPSKRSDESRPEVLLSDEPHPFSEADADVFRRLDIPAARNDRIVFCDGKDLFWYGARSLDGVLRLAALVDELR